MHKDNKHLVDTIVLLTETCEPILRQGSSTERVQKVQSVLADLESCRYISPTETQVERVVVIVMRSTILGSAKSMTRMKDQQTRTACLNNEAEFQEYKASTRIGITTYVWKLELGAFQ